MHSFSTNLAFAVALLMLGWALLAFLALLSPPVFQWRAARIRWPFRNPEILALIWFCSFNVSRGDYFSAILYGIFYGWILSRSKVNVVLTRNQLQAEAIFLGGLGISGVLVYLQLFQRILGPVGTFLLKPLVLLPASFAILLLLVWRGFRATQSAPTLHHKV